MASDNPRDFPHAHAHLQYHLQKIKKIVHSYIADNRNERRCHFIAVETCIHRYERDLKAQNILDDDRKAAIRLLNYALTELYSYFLQPDESHLNKNDAFISAYYLESETLKLRHLARPPDNETE